VRERSRNFLFGIEVKNLGHKATTSAFAIEGNAVSANQNAHQNEVQIGEKVKRLSPIGSDGGLATKRSRWLTRQGNDVGRGHFEAIRVVQQHSIQIVGIPRGHPFIGEVLGEGAIHVADLL
jgi:hypothetical protein